MEKLKTNNLTRAIDVVILITSVFQNDLDKEMAFVDDIPLPDANNKKLFEEQNCNYATTKSGA